MATRLDDSVLQGVIQQGASESQPGASLSTPTGPSLQIAGIGELRAEQTSTAFSRTHRRSLVLRALLAADMIGLLLAYLTAVALTSGGDTTFSHFSYFLGFLLTLPAWAAGAKLLGLYERDDQRPDHSTVDDVGRVFQLVTVGSWLSVGALWLMTSSEQHGGSAHLLVHSGRARRRLACDRPIRSSTSPRIPAEHDHRGCRRGWSTRGPKAPATPGIRHPGCRLRRLRADGDAR